jgi:hypothetical protein
MRSLSLDLAKITANLVEHPELVADASSRSPKSSAEKTSSPTPTAA